MKKILLAILILTGIHSKSQVISIVPNSANYGQTLQTTITCAAGVMQMGSGPLMNNDIYLRKGSSTIYANAFSYTSPYDTVSATFTIPVVTQPGLYDVHVLSWVNFPFPQQYDNVLLNGFSIGNVAGHISGNVYFDTNSNGVRDPGEHGYPSITVQLNNGWSTLTDTAGNYVFDVDTGSYSVSIIVPPPYTLTSLPTAYSMNVPPDSSGNDFGIYVPIPSPLTQQFTMWTHAMRCLYTGFSNWTIMNNTGAVETGSITVIHSSNLAFSYSTIAPTAVNGDTLTWDYTLNPLATISNPVRYNNPAAGDTVWYIMIDSVFDANGVFQNVYSDSFQFIVSCSVDPNDKTVTPQADDSLHLTLKISDLTFTIRFQNTGTDTAFNVLVIDTIDTDLDLSTLQILSSSHLMTTTIDASRAIHFQFDNIMLPDSGTDEPNSHGFIMYKMHANANVVDSTVINNKAEIYFDLNAAVVTNTTKNTLVTSFPTAIDNTKMELNKALVYPNPIDNSSILVLPSIGVYKLQIYNSNGKEVVNRTVSENYKLSNSKFNSGVYYYQLTNNKGTTFSGKFVVVK